jgi:hypothetical protein
MATMERTLEGGTDAGSMVIFDPAALPGDFDAGRTNISTEQLEQLTRAGRLYWLDTHSDGEYRLGIYLTESLPERLTPFARRMDACERFHIPSGRLFFTGVEYVFHSDDSFLRKHSHMGEAIELAAGLDRAEFFEFLYPEYFHEARLQERSSGVQFRQYSLMNMLAPIGCISLLALVGSFWLIPREVWLTTILPCGGALIALPIILSRLPAYKKAAAVYKAIHNEFPDYGIVLSEPLTRF